MSTPQRTDPFWISMRREKEFGTMADVYRVIARDMGCPPPKPDRGQPCFGSYPPEEYAQLTVCDSLNLLATANHQLAHAYYISCYDGPGHDCDQVVPQLEARIGKFHK